MTERMNEEEYYECPECGQRYELNHCPECEEEEQLDDMKRPEPSILTEVDERETEQ